MSRRATSPFVLLISLLAAVACSAEPVTDLAKAVAAAPKGARLELAGTYTLSAPLVVNKTLTLYGAPNQAAIIELKRRNGAVISVVGGTFELQGVRVRGAKNGCGIAVSGSATATLAGCLIDGNGAGGVKASGSAVATLNGCTLKDNGAFGIMAVDKAQLKLAGCECSAIRPTQAGVAIGLAVSGAARAGASGCTLSSCLVGLAVGVQGAVEFTGCNLTGNKLGVRLSGHSRGAFTGCTIGDNTVGFQVDPEAHAEGLDAQSARYAGNHIDA